MAVGFNVFLWGRKGFHLAAAVELSREKNATKERIVVKMGSVAPSNEIKV